MVVVAGLTAAVAAADSARPSYPQAKAVEQIDDYHGTKVADPYRWMEDLDSPELAAWVGEENKVTQAYLAGIPQRAGLTQRLTELWNFEKFSAPTREGGRLFFTKNDGLQNQAVLYWLDKLGGEPRLLLDPNTLSNDGTVALSAFAPSRDGKKLAYALAAAGSDWLEWRVRDVDSGRDLDDVVKWSKFSDAAWTPDGNGFFYSRYAEPTKGAELEQQNYFQKLYFHRLGTPAQDDVLVYERKDQKEWGFSGEVTDDGAYLVVHVWRGSSSENGVFYKRLDTSRPAANEMVELLPKFDATYTLIGNDGPVLWFLTNLEAPRGRVIAIDLRKPQRADWRELVPETEDTLVAVVAVGGRFVGNYLHDASSRVRLFALDGKPQGEVSLPGLGTVEGLSGHLADRETFYSFTGFTTPKRIYRLDPEGGRSEIFREPKVGFDPDAFETRQVFLQSKDGTKVPMFLVQKKGVAAGAKPTLLYGYGGFNVSDDAGVLGTEPGVDGAGRRLRPCQPARRRRVRRGMAPGRHQAAASRTCSTISSPPPSG